MHSRRSSAAAICAAAVLLLIGFLALSPRTAAAEGDGAQGANDLESTVEALPGAASALGLTDCASLALDANQALRQQREGLAKVRAQEISARSEGLPRLELQGQFSRSRDPSFALDSSFGSEGGDFLTPLLQPLYDQHPGLTPPTIQPFSFIPDPADVPTQTFWRTYADLRWELRPTRVYRAVRAAGSAIEQQEAVLEDLEHRTLESVVQAYYSILLSRERGLAMEREVESRAEFLQVTRRRFQLEMVAPLDTLQAAVSLANLRPQLRRRRQELRRAAYDLNRLLGRDPQTPLTVVARFAIEDRPVSEEMALQRAQSRPDLRAEQKLVSILELQRGANSANRHPYLSMDGQWGYVGRDLSTLTDGGHDYWRLGVTLHLPIFDGQVSKGLVKQNEADLRRQQYRLREVRENLREEVLLAVQDRDIALADLQAAQLNLQRAEDAFRQMNRRYELGNADRLEVLDAQAERFTARSALIQARYDVLTSTATLKRAMGGSPLTPLDTLIDSPTPSVEAP